MTSIPNIFKSQRSYCRSSKNVWMCLVPWVREKDVTLSCVPLSLPRLLLADKIPVTGFNQDKVKVVFYRALYPFDARSHDEITITPGDIVMVRGKLSITSAKHHLCVCVCYGCLCKVIHLYERRGVCVCVRVRVSINFCLLTLSQLCSLYLKVKGEWVSAGPLSNQLLTCDPNTCSHWSISCVHLICCHLFIST